AEVLGGQGVSVDLYESLPSPGRKLLFAGKSGLNVTHAEPYEKFVQRFGATQSWLQPALDAFRPDAVRQWATDLGIETFVGSSGRVFPVGFKAAPLLRAWLRRLADAGATLHTRHRWQGWGSAGALMFETPDGPVEVNADATVLALGGASWPRLGSDGHWQSWLASRGVEMAPFLPSNVGFDVAWSAHFLERFEGTPLKGVGLRAAGERARGDVVITANGIEGGAVYELSSILRDAIARDGTTKLSFDLLPDRSESQIRERLERPRGKRSRANHLRQSVGLTGAKAALLREGRGTEGHADAARLAALVKAYPLELQAPRPVAEAISSAGGVMREAVTPDYMIKTMPGVFCAGEMLDWEVRTGGYLLTACFATGRAAGAGAARWLAP
ncbi:MAG: TIGR03862 family flavoprotein, partial [Alphaproteobacteria bacterium]|nr:TIGR03862 family flavoprotein [Alphaproteobacteria bacterium]